MYLKKKTRIFKLCMYSYIYKTFIFPYQINGLVKSDTIVKLCPTHRKMCCNILINKMVRL